MNKYISTKKLISDFIEFMVIITKPKLWKDIPASIRRKLYLIFRLDYVIDMSAKRKGSCEGCPKPCCEFIKCEYYEPKNKKCLAYHNPSISKCDYVGIFLYPFDEKDMRPSTREWCKKQWHWEQTNEAN